MLILAFMLFANRAPCGSPSMSSSGGEKGGELDKPGRCLLIPSATGPNCNDVMISLGECFAINQVIDNEEKRGAIKRSFPRHGHGYAHPANEEVRSRNEDIVYGNKYVSTPVMEVTSGKSYSMGTTSKVTDSKQDARRSVGDIITLSGDGHSSDGEVDVSEGEDYENSAEEEDISCYDDDIVPNSLCIFDDSSHRDGSIYRGTLAWKEVYRIADRNESK